MKLLTWGSFHKTTICVDRKAPAPNLERQERLMALPNHCRLDSPGATTPLMASSRDLLASLSARFWQERPLFVHVQLH